MKKFFVYMLCMAIGSVISTITVFAIIAPHKFPDVDSGSYYASAVDNMSVKGIITGYANGNFGPNDAVLRGQAAVMFDRYDAQVENMRTIICEGIAKADVTNQAIYEEICSSGPVQ